MANYTLTAFSKDAQAVQVGAQQSTKYSNYRANIAGRQAEQSYLREIEREYAERQREADRIALEEARERENQNFYAYCSKIVRKICQNQRRENRCNFYGSSV